MRLFRFTLVAIGLAIVSMGVFFDRHQPHVQAQADPFASLQPGTWYEVPNSHLQDVVPVPTPPGSPSAIMGAWSGGAYDTLRNRLLISGGGHGDYGGNEVYAFDIGTLTWSRIWGPSPIADIQAQTSQACVDTYADGNPVARHTYDSLEYLPNQDVFWLHGGSRYCGSGGFGYDTWTLNLTTPTWTRQADRSDLNRTLTSTAYDPASGHMLVQAYNRLMEYDPDANTWSQRGAYGPGLGDYYTAAYDPIRKVYVLVGNGNVRYYDLSVPGVVNLQSVTTTGDTDIVALRYPGLEYDPVADRIVAWSGGADVYTLNLDTWVWTKHVPAVGNTVTPTAPSTTGTHGRFRYIPSKNAYIAVNAISQNVYLYKLPQITRIDLPLQTWVRRAIPGSGQAPRAGKHLRLAHNPDDGRIYINGGDYSIAGHIDSGRNETWSYSIADDNWTLEYPYCGPGGEVQPMHPDETGWVYDTTRNIFWMVPGYMGADTGDCPGGATQYRYEIMTFDPVADQWTLENRDPIPGETAGNQGFAQYDPVNDTIIQFLYCGVATYDIATNTWTKQNFAGLGCFLPKEYTAMDLVERVIYVIDGVDDTLYRYDMDTHAMDALGTAPDGAGSTRTHPVWDPINQVILWFDYRDDYYPSGGRMHIYHPDTNTWEENQTIVQPEGSTVIGSSVVFDPQQNVLMVTGTNTDDKTYLFLYRYANGVGTAPQPTPDPTPPPDTTAPAAVTNLTAE